MGIIKKLVKEKTTLGIFDDIKYETLRKISLVLVTIFMLNPAIKVLVMSLTGISIDYYMHEYNDYVLFLGASVFLVFLKKLSDEKKLVDIKGWMKGNIPIMLFIVFGVLLVLTTFLNGAPPISISGSYYRGEGLLGYLSYLVYFLLAAFMLTSKQKSKAMNLFAISSVFVAVVIIVDYMLLGEKYKMANGDRMIFSQFNHLGYYLLMAMMNFAMLFISKKKLMHKIASIVGMIVVLMALIMNDTWGCQFAFFMGIIFIVIVYSIAKGSFQWITLVLILAAIFTYCSAYYMDERLQIKITDNILQQMHDTKFLIGDEEEERTTGESRIILWENALEFLWESPIIGHGADVTGERLIEYGNDRCHCEYLNYAVSYGIPATLIYILAVFLVYLRGLIKKSKLTDMNILGLCVAFAYLASAFIGNSMYYTAPFLFITLGMGYVQGNEVKENK